MQQHLLLVFVPLMIGLGLGLPLGLWSARSKIASITALINLFNGLRVIPSLAILFLAIPYFGLSFQSAAHCPDATGDAADFDQYRRGLSQH